MQLFSLVNTLLSADTDSFQRRLHIQRYPVIPLAPNAGLLGWVQDSDTLHVLVRDYRESRKVLLNIEYRLMLQVEFIAFLPVTLLIDMADGPGLREPDSTSESGGFRVRLGEYHWAGSVSGSLAEEH